MSTISFFVPGVARPKGSYNAIPVQRKDGSLKVAILSPKTTNDWMAVVALAANNLKLQVSSAFVEMHLAFILPRPKSPKYPIPLHPDIDKLERAILDGITNILLEDDGQVCKVSKIKRYAQEGETPGCHIRIKPLAVDDIANLAL